MGNKEPRILAINPGTRYIGIAFFQGSELHEWEIKVVPKGTVKQRARVVAKTLADVIEQYGPDVMAIKELHPSRDSSILRKLVIHMKDLGKSNGLEVHQYPLERVERSLSGGEKISKKKLAEVVVEKYPFLLHTLEREKSSRNPYHTRMFEAVALGLVCLRQIEKGH